jgi:hypothetical protein
MAMRRLLGAGYPDGSGVATVGMSHTGQTQVQVPDEQGNHGTFNWGVVQIGW